jgi:SPFH domain / Band 7 family
MANNNCLWICCGSFCVSLVITGIILFSISFRSLEATEFGIKYNSYTKQIDQSQLYNQGTHFLGPTVKFIKFPSQVVALNLSSKTGFTVRTSDGMQLQLVVGIQYSLTKDLQVTLNLIRQWGADNVESVVERLAKDAVRYAGSGFPVDSYVYERSKVDSAMNANLTSNLELIGVQLQNFQLTDVQFPSTFQQIISDTQKLAIEADTVVQQQLKSVQQANGLLTNAPANAQNALTGKLTSLTNQLSRVDQMIQQYTSYVQKYIALLKTSRQPTMGSGLFVAEYGQLVNEKLSSGQWQSTGELVPTPKDYRDMFAY